MGPFYDPETVYRKDNQLKREDIIALQEWASKQAHLPPISERQMILFLHSCYYSLEAAKAAIENYFTVRTHIPEVYQNRDLSIALKTAESILATTLPKRTPEGYDVILTKFLDVDPEKFVHKEFAMYFDMVCSVVRSISGPAKGHIYIGDTEGQKLGHLMRVNLKLAKKLNFYVEEAAPIRLKAIHLINASPVVDKLIGMFKPIMKAEIFEMIHIHSSMESLYKFVPKDILPKEYGGSCGTVDDLKRNTIRLLSENEEFFKKEDAQLVDESKRVGKSPFLSDLCDSGMDGSFKKLDID